MTLSRKPVFGDHDTADGGQEDGVAGQICGEVVGGFEQIPGADGEADDGCEIPSSTDVDESGEQGSQIATSGDRVGGDIGAKLDEIHFNQRLMGRVWNPAYLSEDESTRDEPDTKSSSMARAVLQELRKQVDRGPDGFAVNNLGRRGDDDAQERHNREPERNANDLGPDRC